MGKETPRAQGTRLFTPSGSARAVHNTAAFSIFTELCKYHHCVIAEHSHDPQRNPVPIAVIPSHALSPPLSPLATTHLSLSMDLSILGISYKWNHIIYGWLFFFMTGFFPLA